MVVPVPDQLEYISDADGMTKDYPYPTRFLQKDEIVVVLRDVDGIDTPQYLNQHFSIAGSTWPNGGLVSFYNAPPQGMKVVRSRQTQAKQTVDLGNKQRNDAEAVELQLDRLTMAIQDRGQLMASMQSGLRDEVAARVNADKLLHDKVDQEILDRENADKALASLIGDIGSGDAPLFDTVTAVSLAHIDPLVNAIRTAGLLAVGDGGEALYKRVEIEPAHAAKVQSEDGTWWEEVKRDGTQLFYRFQQVPKSQDVIVTTGYSVFGDGGGAAYKRVALEPSHMGKFQTPDGVWWELFVADMVRPEFFGAVADGIFDCGPAIQSSIDYCMAKGVLGIGLLPRTYAVSRRIIHKKDVSIFGIAGVATIKALAGTADTLIATENYEWLVQQGTSSPGGSQNFTFRDLVLDANRAQNGADTAHRGDGLALYGRNFRLSNVTIKNAPRHGLAAYYVPAQGAWGISPYNANIDGLTIDECGGHGIYWSISDSNWSNVNIASPSQLLDRGYDAVVIKSLVRWTNGAIWKKGNAVNFHRYGIHSVSDGSSIVGVNIETSKSHGILSDGSRCTFDVWIYNILGKYSFYNNGNYNSINLRTSGSFQTHPEATAILNTGGKNSITVLSTGSLRLVEFSGGNFNFIKATGYIGSNPAYVGTYGSYDKIDILGETLTAPIIANQLGSVMRHGNHELRPSYGAGNYGTYYDTQLKKPIWWDGTKWVDASGVSV